MKVPEIIPAEISGYCDVETGQCITVEEATSDGRRQPVDGAGDVVADVERTSRPDDRIAPARDQPGEAASDG